VAAPRITSNTWKNYYRCFLPDLAGFVIIHWRRTLSATKIYFTRIECWNFSIISIIKIKK